MDEDHGLDRPLGRSLDPLPEESLGGYLLRLSHRLRLSPMQLARLTGSVKRPTSTSLSRRLLLDLDTNAFARATRLTETEGEKLTLRPWADRYPPISRSLAAVRSLDSWLFNDSPRYCPQCLAGDGTPIQQKYGGPWKKVWLLPIAFLCPDHLTFLSHGCPRSHQGHRVTPLFAGVKHADLHPAECRLPDPGIKHGPGLARTPCRTRLDRLSGTEPAPSPVIIKMQTRLQDFLSASATAREAAQRFSDLRVVAALICASWPTAQDLLTPDLVSVVAEHVHESDGRGLYSPPRSPMATAALLQAAEAVLDMDDLEQVLTSFRRASWSGLPSVAPWSYILDRHRGSCSERLLLAAEPSIRAFRRDGGASGLRAPTRTVGYRPEHIAAALEHGQFERHLAAFDWGPHTRAARRLAAIKLIQWRTGGAISQAASYLGFAPGPTGYTINKGLRQQLVIHSDQFTAALRALARELDAAPAPVDYRRRRIALSNWSLNQDDWQKINDALPRPRFERHPRRDDDARHGASAFVWAHITQGEARYAPRPIEHAGPESSRHAWPAQCSSTWFHIGAGTTPHHTALRTLLIEFGEQLTKQIDLPTADLRLLALQRNSPLMAPRLCPRTPRPPIPNPSTS